MENMIPVERDAANVVKTTAKKMGSIGKIDPNVIEKMEILWSRSRKFARTSYFGSLNIRLPVTRKSSSSNYFRLTTEDGYEWTIEMQTQNQNQDMAVLSHKGYSWQIKYDNYEFGQINQTKEQLNEALKRLSEL